jgi:UDP-2,4-diacetamido-2,4,6-trideoxy-beta-L-altropyranose hydrolase
MRCLALAQAWQDTGGGCTFVLDSSQPALEQRLGLEQMEVVHTASGAATPDDARETGTLARNRKAGWVVVDGYGFGTEYQRDLRAAGLRVLLVDDVAHCERYDVDILVNPNLHAQGSLYSGRLAGGRPRLGPRYALLRREFRRQRPGPNNVASVARRVLVTIGGSDPDNVSAKVIRALLESGIEGLQVRLVAGAINPHHRQLGEMSRADTRVVVLKDVRDMSEQMAWADAAVASASTTFWELAFLQVPSAVLSFASNQRPVAESLEREGAALNLGWAAELTVDGMSRSLRAFLTDPSTRSRMRQRQRKLVDGGGARRIALEMRGLVLRPAAPEDCRRLWEWANEPSVRNASFSPDPIAWGSHVGWFQRKLEDPGSWILIAEDESGTALGQARFDLVGPDEAEIDVSVDVAHRGRGYGALLIDSAVREIWDTARLRVIHAYIRPSNVGSVRAFERAAFSRSGLRSVSGVEALHYVRENVDAGQA